MTELSERPADGSIAMVVVKEQLPLDLYPHNRMKGDLTPKTPTNLMAERAVKELARGEAKR